MNVTTLDLSKFLTGNDKERKAFSDDLGQSFNQTGFAIIKNHGLKKELTDEALKLKLASKTKLKIGGWNTKGMAAMSARQQITHNMENKN